MGGYKGGDCSAKPEHGGMFEPRDPHQAKSEPWTGAATDRERGGGTEADCCAADSEWICGTGAAAAAEATETAAATCVCDDAGGTACTRRTVVFAVCGAQDACATGVVGAAERGVVWGAVAAVCAVVWVACGVECVHVGLGRVV